MKKIMIGLTVLLFFFSANSVAASANITKIDAENISVNISTGHGNVVPKGKGYENSYAAMQKLKEKHENVTIITVTVDGTDVAAGDPPKVMF